jgi:Uma2 family endonuclease
MPNTPLPIPETKPATELIDGALVRKMSPYGLHGRVQRVVASALGDWSDARGRGRVATEWDFDLTPPGERTNRLVPDVAFLSYARVAYEDEGDAQVPVIAPDVAVEILSQGQTFENSQRRIAIFLACGAKLVVLIDPRAEIAWLFDDACVRVLHRDDAIEHPALPDFSLPLRRCFEEVPPGGFVRN